MQLFFIRLRDQDQDAFRALDPGEWREREREEREKMASIVWLFKRRADPVFVDVLESLLF